MAYEIPTPPTLDALDETAPLGTEDSSLIDDVLRQTRALLKNTFLLEHNADGTHKGGAVAQADPQSITGTQIQNSATDDSKRAIGTNHLKDDAVTTPKLADGAVTAPILAVDAVETTRIKDANVTTNKLADLSVTTGKLAANAVDSAKLKSDAAVDANRAVTVDHIRDGAVATAKIANGAVTPSKVSDIGLSKLIVGNGAGAAVAATVAGDATAALVGSDLIISLVSRTAVSVARVIETPTDTAISLGNFADSDPWAIRPPVAGQSWSVQQTHTGLVNINGKRLVLKAGTYMFRFGSFLTWVDSSKFFQTKIRNVTNGIDLIFTPVDPSGWMFGFGVITLTVDSELEMHVRQLGASVGSISVCRSATSTGTYGAFLEILRISLEDA